MDSKINHSFEWEIKKKSFNFFHEMDPRIHNTPSIIDRYLFRFPFFVIYLL